MKIVLFGLTGYGNEALKSLVKNKQNVALLVTRKEKGFFPYYREENIVQLAKRLNIPASYQAPLELLPRIEKIKPDLILVASYHHIIPAPVYVLARYAVNIHPSLLPKYKGATPTLWALVHGEKETGLTAHFLTERVDSGDIILQKKIGISANDTDCSLRQKLAIKLITFIPELLAEIEQIINRDK